VLQLQLGRTAPLEARTTSYQNSSPTGARPPSPSSMISSSPCGKRSAFPLRGETASSPRSQNRRQPPPPRRPPPTDRSYSLRALRNASIGSSTHASAGSWKLEESSPRSRTASGLIAAASTPSSSSRSSSLGGESRGNRSTLLSSTSRTRTGAATSTFSSLRSQKQESRGPRGGSSDRGTQTPSSPRW